MTKPVEQKKIRFYTDDKGNEPFSNWLGKLRDRAGRQRIIARLKRLQQGNYGDCTPVGEGVSELRMFFGSGYRAYFGERDNNIVIMLCGGDKDSQTKDIETAKTYWKEYQNHEKDENT